MAPKTVQIPNIKEMFPLRKENKKERNKYHTNKANTTRYKKSAIPYLQNILNIQDKKRKNLLNLCEEGS